MARTVAGMLLFVGFVTACLAQAPPSSSGNPANTPTQGESSSKARPDASPDAPVPPSDTSSQDESKKSGAKRLLDRAAPHCLYAIYSTCWELRSNRAPEVTKPDSEYDKDMEIGDFYFKRQNFRAAGSRYSDALERKPNDPEATFRFAASLEKSNDIEHARIAYQAYLMLRPDGPHAVEAKNALRRFGVH